MQTTFNLLPFSCILFALFLWASPVQAQSIDPDVEENFEDYNLGNFSENGGDWKKSGSGEVRIVEDGREESQAVSFTIKKGSKESRAEIVQKGSAGHKHRSEGKTYWTGYSTKVPENYVAPTTAEVVFQEHSGISDGKSPLIGVRIYAGDAYNPNKFDISPYFQEQINDDDAIITIEYPSHNNAVSAKVKKGQWMDWVWMVSWSNNSDGVCKLWIDGKLVFEETGQNIWPSSGNEAYPKYGLYAVGYKNNSAPNDRTYIFDNIRSVQAPEGDVNSNGYAAVAPRGGSTVPSFPVELIGFEAKANQDEGLVELSWETASETNNDFFTLERSTDGLTYEVLSAIPSQGNGTSVQSYKYNDLEPHVGKAYYRLKQTDLDGTFTYFQTVELIYEDKKKDRLRLFPIPVRIGQKLGVEFRMADSKKGWIMVKDMMGRLLWMRQQEFDGGVQTTSIPTEELRPGYYFLFVGGKNKVLAERFLVIK